MLVVLAFGGACIGSRPPEPGDRGLVVTADSLVEFGAELPRDHGRFESLSRNHVVGESVEVEYEFEPGDDHPQAPYVYSLAELHRTRRDACASHRAGILGARLAGDLEDHDEIFRYGEETRFAFIVDEGEPVGTFFSMCRSRTAFLVMIGGLVFDDADLWRELVQPRLDALRRLESP